MIDLKITGLDHLTRTLDDAAKALEGLNGDLATLKFDPTDPSSVEAAVVQMEQAIDARISAYRDNQIVEGLAAKMKEKYRQTIYDRAAKARLQRDTP
jgi:hypothetical protein